MQIERDCPSAEKDTRVTLALIIRGSTRVDHLSYDAIATSGQGVLLHTSASSPGSSSTCGTVMKEEDTAGS